MGKSIELKMFRKRFISLLLVISLLIGVLPADTSIYAAENDGNNAITSGLVRHYDGNGYKVELVFTDVWQGACNANLTINNTSTEVIDNWALSFELGGEILNIWNAYVYEKAIIPQGDSSSYRYTIKNAGHNMDIPVGGQVETGMSIKLDENTNSLLLPDNFIMAQRKMIVSNDDYSVTSFVYGDTNYNYTGFLTIKNISDKVIEDWKLDFITDIDIINFHTAEIVERQGSHYYIKNNGYNSEIKSGEQIFIGFTAKGTIGVNVTGQITEVKMTDVRVDSEGNPVVTITEPITPSPTVTEEPTVTVMATATPTPTPTELITSEPTATEEITPTEVVEPTEIITPTPSITDEITPTVVPSEEPTVEPTEIVTDTPEPTTPITDIPTPSPVGEYTEEQLFSDTDGDALPFVSELHYGTDPENPDTDGDGIFDYIEIVNGLNPLVPDDRLEGNFDSDCDGLYDRLELYTYFTDPLNPDTDGDELEDGFEIQNGFDPLRVDTDEDGIWDGDEIFEQTFEYSLKDMDYKYGDLVNMAGSTGTIFGVERDIPDSIGAVTGIDITTNVSKDIKAQFSIENLYGENVMASNIPGLVGVPFDISTDTDFEKATVIFKYDDSKLGECNEENLRLLWYNEDESHFVLLEDAILDTEKNTITYETTHFCIFSIVDFDIWKTTWEFWVRYYSKKTIETKGSTALELCIDIGSDFFKNNETEIKKSLKRFVNAKFPKDSVSIVSFYKRYILVDEGIHFASEEDRKNEHMEKIDLTSTKSKITLYLSDGIQPQNSFCSTLGVLSSIKDYFENSDNINDKKAVIMVSTALLDPNVNKNLEEIMPYFRDNNIELYQTYIGDLSREYEANATATLKSTGGYLREITESSNFTGILNTILNKLNGYDVVFLIDSGSNSIKEEWDRFIQGTISAVNGSTLVSSITLNKYL